MAGEFEDERQAIESRFAEQWAASPYAAVPIAWENVRFTPPDPAADHLALYILDGSSDQISCGGPGARVWDRHSGVIQVSVFVPVGTGTMRARSMAEVAGAIFERVTMAVASNHTIRCATAQIRANPISAVYKEFDVSIPFERDISVIVAA